jgi:glycosyltransferase involved in cell wall biosynthesis
MRLAYVTPFDAQDLTIRDNWSGLGYYIAQALKNQSIDLEYIGPLEEKLSLQAIRKCKRFYYKILGKNYIKDSEPLIYRDYAEKISKKLLSIGADIVFSAASNPIAYLECDQPIVFWADATFANLIDFYPVYSNLCEESLQNAHFIERLALEKSRLAIYTSEWAAQTAIEYYNTDPNRVKVVPWGANLEDDKTIHDVKDLIEARPSDQCKLLFLGVDWFRKGGDIALQVAEQLNNSGLKTELTVVGCQPITDHPLPDFVKPQGYISKSTVEGKKKIGRLIAESHFLILPSKAECYGLVFCEANSFGVPCVSKRVGGIPTIIKDEINGKLFDEDSASSEYAEYILTLFSNYTKYKNLSLSSFNEYQSRLNWKVAGQKVKDLLMTIV